ncbi:uncharacterized protein LOC119165608 isoform X2 [Rhipicephalus microplus]|uniref:uncharacterized protein LOC119165608 isoform X2 n=1 Tax=Rhipicephalus microplus TaxID=6941 RepID=UPI003F6CAD9E
MELPGPASLVFIILSVSGITKAARLFAAEHGTQVRLPCDENVETTDESSGLSTFDAVWTDPRGVTLADDGDQSGAELRGEPWVDAFSGDLSLAAVDFADAGEYSCRARYADGESLTEPRVSKHVLQVACAPGQYGKDGACHVCSVGSFNERHGALCCQRCPFLYVTWGRGATSRKECSGVIHDFLIGLAVMACLSLNLYALVKFSGPIVLDNLCEYVSKEARASKSTPGADARDDDTDDGMPDDVFDGISKLVARLKRRKLPEASGEEGIPLLLTSKSSLAVVSESSNEDDDLSAVCFDEETSVDATDDAPQPTSEGSNEVDDGDQSIVFDEDASVDDTDDAPQPTSEVSNEVDDGDQSTVFDEDTSVDDTDNIPQIVPVLPRRRPNRPSIITLGALASGDDDYVDLDKQPLGERYGTSPEETSSESDVVLVGSPEEDWLSSGRRRWIGRYDVIAARASICEERRFQTTTALSDGRCSELSGGATSLPEQRATYDLFLERWSSRATADDTSEVSFVSDCSRNYPMDTNACGSSARSSGSCNKGSQDARFYRGPLKYQPQSAGTTLASAHSSSDRHVISIAPTWNLASGHHKTKLVRKPASCDELASEKKSEPERTCRR